MPVITVTAQGRVLEVHVEYPERLSRLGRPPVDVPRGTICGMSAASRLRLLKFLMKIQWQRKFNKFITLTYPAEFPDTGASKAHLRAFLERVRRKWKTTACVWKLEFQERGAPHFHLASPNWPYQNKCSLQKMWGEVIGYESVFTRIDSFDRTDVLKYLSKYVSKPRRGQKNEKRADMRHYQDTMSPEEAWTGRVWGCHNRPSMPMSCRHQSVSDDYLVYRVLRERSTVAWPGLAELPEGSFTLFVDDAVSFAGFTD